MKTFYSSLHKISKNSQPIDLFVLIQRRNISCRMRNCLLVLHLNAKHGLSYNFFHFLFLNQTHLIQKGFRVFKKAIQFLKNCHQTAVTVSTTKLTKLLARLDLVCKVV